MSKRIYTEILRGNYKSLGYYADELLEVDTGFDFFRHIALYIVPLIQKSQAFERFYFQCLKAKDAYLVEKDELEIKAPEEIEKAFASLQLDLENKDLPELKRRLDRIKEIFNKKHTYGSPSYIQVIFEEIRSLLEVLLSIGEIDLVKKYAIVDYRFVNTHNAQTYAIEEIQKWYIEACTFAPSLMRLNEVQDIFRWNNVQDEWIAWEYFALVAWCWNIPFSFFNDKTLDHKDYRSNNTSMQLLALHGHWIELNNIKKLNSQTKALFFDRPRFIKFLKIILNAIILRQEIHDTQYPNTINTIPSEEETPTLYSLKLRLDYTRLLLEVQWFADGGVHTYIVHCFQTDSGGPYDFMKALLEASIMEKIDVRKVCDASKVSVAKYLEYMKLDNILGRIFIERPKSNRTYVAAMKCNPITCQELAKADQLELMRFIKSLPEFKSILF